MSKGNTFENDFLQLIFLGTAIADIAQNDATIPLTALQLALHTADPGEAGTQTTSEANYGAYVRKAVTRATAGFKVTGNTVYLRAATDFAAATSGSSTCTYFSVGTATSGTGKILYSGAITPSLAVTTGVTPRLTTGTNITED